METKPIIGWIGTGVMGKSMAGHLLNAGYKVHVYNRTSSKTEDLVAKGATNHDTPRALAEKVDVVILMVGLPSDVESVIFDETNGIKDCLK